MKDRKECNDIISQIDGMDYAEYVQIIGDYDFTRYILKIIDVSPESLGDSVVFQIYVPQHVAGFPARLYNTPIRRTALEDLLIRRVVACIANGSRFDSRGLAVRRMQVSEPAPQILPRSVLKIADEHVELLLHVALPSVLGKVDGASLRSMFFEELPDLIDGALVYCNLDDETVTKAIDLMDQADQLRQMLSTQGLVAFIPDGTGVEKNVQAGEYDFRADDSVAVTMEVPETAPVRGIGVPAGITLIIGNEQQGRCELMNAIAMGIYNHSSADGRRLSVTVPDAVQVVAAPGRSVQHVNLSAFLRAEGGEPAATYSTDCADAFVSQAAGAIEALMVGARVLLFDEADSAPSFLCRDERLQPLMADEKTACIPLSLRARDIVDSLGVSLVVAGSTAVTDFISVADTVLYLRDGTVFDVTQRARELVAGAIPEPTSGLAGIIDQVRWVVPGSVDPSCGVHDAFARSESIDRLQFGRSLIKLDGVSQIADRCQTETIGIIFEYVKERYLDQPRPIREILDLVDRDLSTEGLDCLTRELRGDLARPRRYEIAAALNRMPSLRITDSPE